MPRQVNVTCRSALTRSAAPAVGATAVTVAIAMAAPATSGPAFLMNMGDEPFARELT